MSTNTQSGARQREAVAEILGGILADQHVLYVKTRSFHWNVTGPQFSVLHALFEKQYDALAEAIDETAERIRALGAPSPGSMAEFLKAARLKEHIGRAPNAHAMLETLLADHEAMARQLRADADRCAGELNDASTNDFLIGLLQEHEKTAWMLRAHLEQA